MREVAGLDLGGSHIRVDVGGSAMMRADAALVVEGVDGIMRLVMSRNMIEGER